MSTTSYGFDGTCIADRCTSSNCKGTGLSDLATGIVTNIFGQRPR